MSKSLRSSVRALGLGIMAAAMVATSAWADGHLSLDGKKIGVAVVGTQHFWDREAFNGAIDRVKELGGDVVPVDGGRDNQVHADNHDILLNSDVDAVISILGDGAVEPKFEALKNAGVPVFTVDHLSPHGINNTTSDNYYMGTTIGRYMADAIGGEGKVAIFNAFEGALRICGIRAGLWKYVMQDYPGIEIMQPELAEEFANAPEDARKKDARPPGRQSERLDRRHSRRLLGPARHRHRPGARGSRPHGDQGHCPGWRTGNAGDHG